MATGRSRRMSFAQPGSRKALVASRESVVRKDLLVWKANAGGRVQRVSAVTGSGLARRGPEICSVRMMNGCVVTSARTPAPTGMSRAVKTLADLSRSRRSVGTVGRGRCKASFAGRCRWAIRNRWGVRRSARREGIRCLRSLIDRRDQGAISAAARKCATASRCRRSLTDRCRHKVGSRRDRAESIAAVRKCEGRGISSFRRKVHGVLGAMSRASEVRVRSRRKGLFKRQLCASRCAVPCWWRLSSPAGSPPWGGLGHGRKSGS